jgi:hypothetical protein
VDEPFFIVGASRSGTTLMRLVLNSHPDLAVPGETHYFLHVYERYAGTGEWTKAVEEFLTLCEDRLRPPVDLSEVRANLLSMTEPDFRALLTLPLDLWAAHEGKPRWGEKTPEHLFCCDQIVKFFPGASFIELIRDPRAVVASMGRSKWKSSDSTRNALYWQYVATTGHERLNHAVAPGKRISVRYEDLVTYPEPTLRSVCELLEVDWDPSILSFHEQTSTYLPADRAEDDPRLRQPFEADLHGWRNLLTPRQIAITEAICAREMATFGYQREGRNLTRSERAEIVYKQGYVTWKHRQQRHKHFHVVTAPPFGRVRRAVQAART